MALFYWIYKIILLQLVVGFCHSVDSNVANDHHSTEHQSNICDSLEIWSPNDKAVSILKNCTIVDGYVHLVQFDMKSTSETNLSFPNLKEISGYLMIYRVTGFDSVGEIFPNLAVIRGNVLFENFALILFEMFDLKRVSLTSLTDILKGDIFIASNVNLCYVDTLEWSLIAPGSRKHYIAGNKSPNECPVCSKNCTNSFSGKSSCWNEDICQSICPLACPKSCSEEGECCHPLCLGGCWGTGPDKCFSCRNYVFHETCIQSCPKDTFIYSGWRCILESECYALPKSPSNKFWKPHNGQCLLDCPPGYHEQEIFINGQKRFQCRRCEGGMCRKECRGALISSVEDSRKMQGCTVIRGGIMISLSGHGKNIVPQLESSLSGIEEISDYLKISDSYQLTSLNFLKNLKYIHGYERYKSKYSLIVIGNKNLELLWDFKNKGSGLKINGSVYFRSNPKLCLNKIQELLDEAKVSVSDSFYPSLTNGVKNVCDLTELIVNVKSVTSTSATVLWRPFEFHDMRKLMGYVIYVKQAGFVNVTVFDGRNECGGGDWKVYDVSFFDCCADNFTITGLLPFTRYAFYMKTVTVNADFGAQSVIKYFSTLPGIPFAPFELTVDINSYSEIALTWVPPIANGILSHYLVSVHKVEDLFTDIDYCEESGAYPVQSNSSKYLESDSDLNDYTDGAKQVLYESMELSDEQRRRLNDIHFENKLQNYIYVKYTRTKRNALVSKESESSLASLVSSDSHSGNSTYISNDMDYKPDGDTVLLNKIVYEPSLTVSNLKHFTHYLVEVRACRQLLSNESYKSFDKYCSPKRKREVQTFASVVADSIADEYPLLEVSNDEPGMVTLKWSEPVDPNGMTLSYTIEYRRNGYSSTKECISQKQFFKAGKCHVIKNLSPGNYSVRIRASSMNGAGPYTSLKYFFIKDDASIHTYIYLVIGTLLFILPPSIAYCIYLRKTEKNKLFISVNPEYIHKTYVPDAWEIPRSQIDLIKEIGQGSFGMVYEGLLNSKPCAVKTVNAQASESEKKEFLNEASVMKAFDTFHVVKLLGVVSFSEPVFVIMELMPNGDLKSFLRAHRPDVCDPHVRPPSLRRLLQMSAEIADGMAYLSAKKYVHRDLAARNCMVTENLTVKIGDFGMARDIYVGDYYRKGTRGLMPVRWMAPESLRDGIFLSASDVWSYGVVLYEMVTLAAQPYPGLTNDQVLRYVMDGGIIERPENCPDKMFILMKKCWKHNPNNRPMFLEIVEMLHDDASLNFHGVSFYDSDEGKEHRRSAEANTEVAISNNKLL